MYTIINQSKQEGFIYRDLCSIEIFFATGVRVYEVSNT